MTKYKVYPSFTISSLQKKDECYFEYLFDVILNVKKSFVIFKKTEQDFVEHLERVFAYELYRQ